MLYVAGVPNVLLPKFQSETIRDGQHWSNPEANHHIAFWNSGCAPGLEDAGRRK